MGKTNDKPKPDIVGKRDKLPYGDIKFVLNNLDDSQIADMDAYEAKKPDLSAFVTDCIDKGMDIKIAYDNYSKGYQAMATGAYRNFPSAGFACSGFSRSDAMDALFVLWYKVAIVCQFDLSSADGRESRNKKQRG